MPSGAEDARYKSNHRQKIENVSFFPLTYSSTERSSDHPFCALLGHSKPCQEYIEL
jgi:hypothetical protein